MHTGPSFSSATQGTHPAELSGQALGLVVTGSLCCGIAILICVLSLPCPRSPLPHCSLCSLFKSQPSLGPACGFLLRLVSWVPFAEVILWEMPFVGFSAKHPFFTVCVLLAFQELFPAVCDSVGVYLMTMKTLFLNSFFPPNHFCCFRNVLPLKKKTLIFLCLVEDCTFQWDRESCVALPAT